MSTALISQLCTPALMGMLLLIVVTETALLILQWILLYNTTKLIKSN